MNIPADYNEKFYTKYTTESEENGKYLYEYKNGEFQAGEIIGMVTIPNQCEETAYKFEKDTTQEYIPIIEFYSEEGYRENDLQVPFCSACQN